MGFRDFLADRGIISSDTEVLINAVALKKQVTPATMTATDTLTVDQLLTGLILATPVAAVNYTLPTGTLMDAALTDYMVNDASFDVVIINLSPTDANEITLLAGVGFTIVGQPIVDSNEWEVAWYGNTGTFRCRKTAANTFVAYRIS